MQLNLKRTLRPLGVRTLRNVGHSQSRHCSSYTHCTWFIEFCCLTFCKPRKCYAIYLKIILDCCDESTFVKPSPGQMEVFLDGSINGLSHSLVEQRLIQHTTTFTSCHDCTYFNFITVLRCLYPARLSCGQS